MNIFQFVGFFFIISLFKSMYDGLTYRSWTSKKIIYGHLKHIAAWLLIITTGFLFAIYGHYYDILNVKGTIILLLAFACLNFVWFNTLYRIFSGENLILGTTDPIDISILFVFSLLDKFIHWLTGKEPNFSFIPIYWFLKIIVFCIGLWLIDKFIAA